jgi:hypothetical protein
MMTDPIADMLTRIRNAVRIERTILDMPASNMRRGIAQVLKEGLYLGLRRDRYAPGQDAPAPHEIRPQRGAADQPHRPDQ